MGRMVKCPYCSDQVDKDVSIPHQKRYYHESCLNAMKRESDDYKSLMAYVVELFGEDKPVMLLKKQIKDMKDEGYKYKGMELALRYFFDTLGNRVQENTGVGIIPYVYEQAKQHYIKQRKIAESVHNLENEEMTVYINPEKAKRKSKKIDISAI